MKTPILALFCSVALVGGGSGQSPTSSPATAKSALPPQIPLRYFFKNPVSRGYQISPDGQTISFLQPWETRMTSLFDRLPEVKPSILLRKRTDAAGRHHRRRAMSD